MAEERLTAEERADLERLARDAPGREWRSVLVLHLIADLKAAEARLAELAAAVREHARANLGYVTALHNGWSDEHTANARSLSEDAFKRLDAALAAAEGQPAPPTEGG